MQSVAVRLVVEREQEITAFIPEEYWTVEAEVEGSSPPPFTAKVAKLDGTKVELTNEGEARAVVEALESASPRVASIERKERRKNAPPPFITSKLQQEASSKLRFSPKRTMGLAQRLYEGVEVGEEGLVGLITYMRTDSTRISDDALGEVRAYIGEKLRGRRSLPAAADRLQVQEAGPGRPRGDPADLGEARSRDGARVCGRAARAAGATSARPKIC